MKKIHLSRFRTAGAVALSIATLAAVGGPVMAKPAAAGEITLAPQEQALAVCRANKMGQWDIAYFNGKDGIAQWGPGYDCKQSPVPADISGVANAIQSDGKVVTLAPPEEAAKLCPTLGPWDIAYVNGKDGIAQWGPGYGCKQSRVPGAFSGVSNAITK
ncbi:hypothetical protein [Nitrospirillum iridis]|uniref:Uncharacterized protein n=1 Tax=Nitrospirillum iridis TaxID=765888 RepID=A0A7X0AVV1_9PROT|nr:hypothetical protein [Nitrospirillum iridis]MBB6251077.1 hypothetical protein [Nitrospirillum iridis]